MEEIDVRSLVRKNVFEGELAFEFEPDATLLDLPYTEFDGPARAKLKFEIGEENDVAVNGTLTFGLKGSCSRCLAPAEAEIEGEVDGVFSEGEDDGERYGYTRGVVTLVDLMRDSLLFALPSRLLCERCRKDEEM